MVRQRLHHLRIGELQQPRPLLHQNHAHPQRGEHAGVLDPDYAAAHHDHRLRQILHLQDLVAIDDGAPVDRHPVRCRRLGSRGDHHHSRFVFDRPARVLHPQLVRIDETRRPHQQLDVVARHLRLCHVDFGLDHMLHPERQVGHRDLLFYPVIDAVNVLILVPGKVQHRFPQRLARYRSGVDADAADHLALFHQRHPLARFRALYRSPLAGRPGTDHHQIEGLHAPPNLPTSVPASDRPPRPSRSPSPPSDVLGNLHTLSPTRRRPGEMPPISPPCHRAQRSSCV